MFISLCVVSDLRLTVDRNVTLIDETFAVNDNNDSWCLPDDALIKATMATQIPYVVFEIKLSGEDTTTLPGALAVLQEQGVIREARKFSKFLTGAATFNSGKLTTLPWWAENPSFATMFGMKDTSETDSESQSSISSSGDVLAPIDKPSKNKSGVSFQSRDSFGVSQAFTVDTFVSRKSWTENNKNNKKSIASKRPAKVEPKSYFANERTFVQWISASLLLLTIAVLLVGYGADHSGSASSYAFTAGVALCCGMYCSQPVFILLFSPFFRQLIPNNVYCCRHRYVIGAVVIVLYSTFVYFRRIRLLSTGSSYGYIDHVGPVLLAAGVAVGVIIMLIEVASSNGGSSPILRQEPGQCILHSNGNILVLQFEPSDLAVDEKRSSLLVPSTDEIYSFPLDAGTEEDELPERLVEIPNSDLEGITTIGDRVFALSEGPIQTELIDLVWINDELVVQARWTIPDSATQAEGLTFIPNGNNIEDGRLYVDIDGTINAYAVPDTISFNDEDVANESLTLERLHSLNMEMLSTGFKSSPKIAGLYYFEGVTYILYDNKRLIRGWDVKTGELLSEIPLPTVGEEYSTQWEGIAFERRTRLSSAIGGNLRGTSSQDGDDDSALLVHLALDTPAQVWTFAVEETGGGNFIFPECAAAPKTEQ